MTPEPKNGNVSWKIFIWIVAGIITFAGFTYAISVSSMDKQFDNVDIRFVQLRTDFNKHLEIQNQNDLKIAESLGEIKAALKIPIK